MPVLMDTHIARPVDFVSIVCYFNSIPFDKKGVTISQEQYERIIKTLETSGYFSGYDEERGTTNYMVYHSGSLDGYVDITAKEVIDVTDRAIPAIIFSAPNSERLRRLASGLGVDPDLRSVYREKEAWDLIWQ